MNQEEPQLIDLSKPNAYKPRRVLYYAMMSAMYLSTIGYFIGALILPHTLITMSEEDHIDLLTDVLRVFEMNYPNSGKNVSSIIPKNWAPEKAQYSFYNNKICREIEGHQRICDKANGESISTGLLAQFGLQIATAEPNQQAAFEWAKASSSALEHVTDEWEIGWGCQWTDSRFALYRCANKTPALSKYLSTYLSRTSPKFAVGVMLVLFAFLVAGALSIPFKSTRAEGAFTLITILALTWIVNIAVLITECLRYDPLELLKNHRHLIKHGSYFNVLICATIVMGVHPILVVFFKDVNWFRHEKELVD